MIFTLLFFRWLRTVHAWLPVRFSLFPLIYSCAGNKLVKGRDKLVKGVANYLRGVAD